MISNNINCNNYLTDFSGKPVSIGEIVAIVYYSGTLMFAKVHKVNSQNGFKISFGDVRYKEDKSIVSKWKSKDAICKLEGQIIPNNKTVCRKTGAVIDYVK